MRKAGYLFLLGGFAATVFMCAQVSMLTYTSWMWHTKNMPSEDRILRTAASAEMRELSFESNHLVRRMIWPALLMLTGGLMIGKQKRN